MAALSGIPPGRAGRLWLRNRLASAQRGLDLLDRKRQLLIRELAGLIEERDRSHRHWVEACALAQEWYLRATIIGGAQEVGRVASGYEGRATVSIPWGNTMGVHHPSRPTPRLPQLSPTEAATANTALTAAAAAYRNAIEAGVAYAAVERSYRVLESELRATERRRRAIERRRIPILEESLAQLELRLEELEREERVSARWAKRSDRSYPQSQG